MTANLPTVDARWIAAHVFYAAAPQPLLTEGVASAFQRLKADRLIDRYFFMNYWLEGGHVRVRVRPSEGISHAVVREQLQHDIEAFLRRRPALYSYEVGPLREMYDRMFEAEFSAEERARRYPGVEHMPLRSNNSIAFFDYEPEYGKYGGKFGVELAEWHFEASSDLVLDLLRTTNAHVRSVQLGTCAQLMYILARTFLDDPVARAKFFDDYFAFWQRSVEFGELGQPERYEDRFDRNRESIVRRFRAVEQALDDPEASGMGFITTWIRHCRELRSKVVASVTEDKLRFPDPGRWTSSGSSLVPDSGLDYRPTADEALRMLAFPFMHMTNNRLSATLIDEAYLSFTLGKVQRALTGAGSEHT